MRGATSTSTSARAIASSGCSPIAASDATPPSDAPTSAGGSSSAAADRDDVAGERVERVVAVGRPCAVAVPAQIDRVRPPAHARRARSAWCPTSAGSGRRRATAPRAGRPAARPRRPPAGSRRARRTRSVPRTRFVRSCTRPRARPRRAAFRVSGSLSPQCIAGLRNLRTVESVRRRKIVHPASDSDIGR